MIKDIKNNNNICFGQLVNLTFINIIHNNISMNVSFNFFPGQETIIKLFEIPKM